MKQKIDVIASDILNSIINEMRNPIAIRGFHGGRQGATAYSVDENEDDDATIFHAIAVVPLKHDKETMEKYDKIKNDPILNSILLALALKIDGNSTIREIYESIIMPEEWRRLTFVSVVEADDLIKFRDDVVYLAKKVGHEIDPYYKDNEFEDYDLWKIADIFDEIYKETDIDVERLFINISKLMLIWPFEPFTEEDIAEKLIDALHSVGADNLAEMVEKYYGNIRNKDCGRYDVDHAFECPAESASNLCCITQYVIENIIDKTIGIVKHEYDDVLVIENGEPIFRNHEDYKKSTLRRELGKKLKELLVGPFLKEEEMMKKLEDVLKRAYENGELKDVIEYLEIVIEKDEG